MTYRTKTTLAMLSMTLACLIAFAGLTINKMRGALLEAAVDLLQAVADSRVSEIEGLIRSYRSMTNLVTSRTRLRDLLATIDDGNRLDVQAAMSRILADAVRAESAIESASVIDLVGTVVASTNPELVGLRADQVSEDPGLLTADADATVIRVIIDDGGGSPSVVALGPLRFDGRSIGSATITFRPDALDRAIHLAGFGKTGEVLLGLRDQHGHARFVTPVRKKPDAAGEVLAFGSQDYVPMVRALAGEDTVLREGALDYDGTPVVAVTRHLPSLGWGVVAKLDTAEVVATIRSVRDAMLGLAACLVAVAIGTGQYVGKRLSQAAATLESELESRTRAERRFSKVVASAPTAMLMIAADGRIVLANEQAERLLGYDAETMLSMQVEALVPDTIRGGHAALREKFMASPATRAMGASRDLFALHRDGRQVPVEIGLMPIEADDGPMVLVALVDLSARKAAERALAERAEALARSNRELDDFAYVASHDLRAPLRGIDQLAGFVIEDAADLLPEESRADLMLLRGRVGRMEALLEGLLQYSRIGRKEGEPRDVDVWAVVAELTDLYVPNEKFRVERAAESPPLVYAPRAAVELVFRNLLMNSVKHHDLEHGVIRIDWKSEGDEVVIILADDGPGIPSDCTDKVFELFSTLRARDEVESSGMGLALVKKTIETHGGAVELVANEARGATFVVRWPSRGVAAREAA